MNISLSLYIYIDEYIHEQHIYIYIYIFLSLSLYIYIYIYIYRYIGPPTPQAKIYFQGLFTIPVSQRIPYYSSLEGFLYYSSLIIYMMSYIYIYIYICTYSKHT